MNPRHLCLLAMMLVSTFAPVSLAQERTRLQFHEESLNIVIPGMNAQPDDHWVAHTASISPTRERFIIVFDDGNRNQDRNRNPFQPLLGNRFDRNDARLVDDAHIIRLRDATSPQSQAALRRIAQTPNATVMVDMNIPLRVTQRSWGPQAEFAGRVAAELAIQHRRAHPRSHIMLLGHSAGTEAMAVAQRVESLYERQPASPPPVAQRVEDLPTPRGGALFNTAIAQSPRRPDRLALNTVMVVGDGDFYYSPGGRITPNSIGRTMGAGDAEALAAQGYRVVRAVGDPIKKITCEFWANRAAGALGQLSVDLENRIRVHSNVVQANSNPDQRFMVYPSGSGRPVEMPPSSLGNVLREFVAATRQEPGTASAATPPSGPSPAQQLQRLQDAAKAIRRNDPTPGIGGISLNATATTPINPESIKKAGFRTTDERLFLEMKDGKIVLLPNMDPEIVTLCYRVVCRDNKKPELSFGSQYFVTPEGDLVVNPTPPGKNAVFYLGGTENTLLGLAMYQADLALGDLTYGSPEMIKEVSQAVPGYHSMPEIYPHKYTDHVAQERFMGAGNRVFMHSSVVRLEWTKPKDALEFAQTSFAVRHGNTGPAEAIHAAFFMANFDRIAATKMGAPFRNLAPFARAAAVFRWLKTNEIPFDAADLQSRAVANVVTPHDVRRMQPTTLEQVWPPKCLPIVVCGPDGPEQIIDAKGAATLIDYAAGRVMKVKRPDGSLLEVKRDDLGSPVGLRLAGKHHAAFYPDADLGLVFAENLKVIEDLGQWKFSTTKDTILLPESNPETTVGAIVSRFAMEGARK